MTSEYKRGSLMTVGAVLTSTFTFLLIVWTGRVLGPEDGSDFFAFTFFYFLTYAFLSPLGHTLARFGSEAAAKERFGGLRQLALKSAGFALALSVGLSLAATLFADDLTSKFQLSSPRVIPLSVSAAVLASWAQIVRGSLRAVQQYTTYTINLVLESLIRLVIGGAVLVISPDVVGLVSAFSVSLLVVNIHGSWQLYGIWRSAPREAGPSSRTVRRFALPMLVLVCASGFLEMADVFYAKAEFLGLTAGAYGAAATLARTVSTLAYPFLALALPRMVYLRRAGGDATRALFQLLALYLLFAATTVMMLALWSDDILVLVFGEAYEAASAWIAIMALGNLLGAVSVIVAHALAGADRFGYLAVFVAAAIGEAAIFSTVALVPSELILISLMARLIAFLGALVALIVARRKPSRSPS